MKRTLVVSIILLLSGCETTGVGSNWLDGMRSSAPVSADGAELVSRMLFNSFALANAQLLLSEALGLQEDQVAIRNEMQQLQSDSAFDPTQFNKFIQVSNTTQARIDEKLAARSALTSEQRKQFSLGALHYASAVYQTREVYEQIQALAGRTKKRGAGLLTSLNFGDLGATSLVSGAKEAIVTGGDTALLVGASSSLVQLMPAHVETLGSMLSFMESGNIEVPPDFRSGHAKAFGGPSTIACAASDDRSCLWVRVSPVGARIILPDVKPRYEAGIELASQQHRIKVVKHGYVTKMVTTDLSKGNKRVAITMQPVH